MIHQILLLIKTRKYAEDSHLPFFPSNSYFLKTSYKVLLGEIQKGFEGRKAIENLFWQPNMYIGRRRKGWAGEKLDLVVVGEVAMHVSNVLTGYFFDDQSPIIGDEKATITAFTFTWGASGKGHLKTKYKLQVFFHLHGEISHRLMANKMLLKPYEILGKRFSRH